METVQYKRPSDLSDWTGHLTHAAILVPAGEQEAFEVKAPGPTSLLVRRHFQRYEIMRL